MNFSSRSNTPVIHFLFLLRSIARSVKRELSDQATAVVQFDTVSFSRSVRTVRTLFLLVIASSFFFLFVLPKKMEGLTPDDTPNSDKKRGVNPIDRHDYDEDRQRIGHTPTTTAPTPTLWGP